jgi:flagellar biosynthetic protein FlhB
MAEDMGDKTELPTERKREDARNEGRVARSTELTAAVDLIGAFLLIMMLGGTLAAGGSVILRDVLGSLDAGGESNLADLCRRTALAGARVVGPLLLLICAVAVVANVAQVGFLLTTKPLEPKLDRMNPVSGLKRIFSMRSLAKAGVNILKAIAIGAVAWFQLRGAGAQLTALPLFTAAGAWAEIFRLAAILAIWLLVIMLLIGMIDYTYQRWQHTRDLRMTKHEVKDERRSMEGDPQLKGRRLRMAREIAMQRINGAVPKADVIITNPTHFSIAIRYEEGTMRAPRVVAKGVDELAMRIRHVARTHRVPIVERPPLARAIYRSVPVGHEIRPEFYEAVAEVLAYVYRLEQSQNAPPQPASPTAAAA